MADTAIAPGARVLIRGAEWIVKRVDRTGTGGQSIQAVGVSEIVRHKEARFLSEIEGKGITVLTPKDAGQNGTVAIVRAIRPAVCFSEFGERRFYAAGR
jgi:hypothetical protein